MDSRDPHSLQRLYQQAGRAALLKTMRLVGRRDIAEEIVQSAFLKLWDSGARFEAERAAFAWIYRTCHNAGIDHLRSAAARYETGGADRKIDQLAASDDQERDLEARRALVAKLSSLSDREAQVLAYRALDGMSQEEIAEVMKLSRKTIVRICAAIAAKFSSGDDQDSAMMRGLL